MTISQAAEKWGVSRTMVTKWINSGRLQHQLYQTPDGQKIIIIPDNAARPPRAVKE